MKRWQWRVLDDAKQICAYVGESESEARKVFAKLTIARIQHDGWGSFETVGEKHD